MNKTLQRILLTSLATVIIGLMIIPFFIMISTSFKSFTEVTVWPPDWIPDVLRWENYKEVWSGSGNFKQSFTNSLIVSTSTMLICAVLGSLGAYAVSRFEFKGKKSFLFIIIVTQMFSSVTLVGPMYKIVRSLGLLNTHIALIVPNAAFALPMTVWLLYGYLDGISKNLEEAAMIDGCTRLQAVSKVLLPLVAPGIITSALFAFIVSWNDLIFARSFVTKTEFMTLSVSLTNYRSLFETRWHEMMAASVISVVPVFILFLLIQKHLVKGLASGGVKE